MAKSQIQNGNSMIGLPVEVGATRRVRLVPTSDRGNATHEGHKAVSEVSTTDEVCAQEVAHLSVGRVLGSRSVRVNGGDDKHVGIPDISLHGEHRLACHSYDEDIIRYCVCE